MINFLFTGCKPEQQMMYAGSKNILVQAAEMTKVAITDNLTDNKHNKITLLINDLK